PSSGSTSRSSCAAARAASPRPPGWPASTAPRSTACSSATASGRGDAVGALDALDAVAVEDDPHERRLRRLVRAGVEPEHDVDVVGLGGAHRAERLGLGVDVLDLLVGLVHLVGPAPDVEAEDVGQTDDAARGEHDLLAVVDDALDQLLLGGAGGGV